MTFFNVRVSIALYLVWILAVHSSIDRPARELKRFQRIEIGPGEQETVVFVLNRDDFSYWNPETKRWTLDPGKFEIQVGASSRDIRLRAPIEVTHRIDIPY